MNFHTIRSSILLSLLLLFCMGFPMSGTARVISSTQNGNWNDTSTWNPASIPMNGDTIVIQAGDTVDLTGMRMLNNVWIQVYGCLDFSNGGTIILEMSSRGVPASLITFHTGFSLMGGNGSSGISFGPGNSGCDIYRPGTGNNSGVYPMVGSYYDGCTHASYLNALELETSAQLRDGILVVEWHLNEPMNAQRYVLIGGTENEEQELASIRADKGNMGATYTIKADPDQYAYFRLEMETMDQQRQRLYSFTPDLWLDHLRQVKIFPNPFRSQLRVMDTDLFDVQLSDLQGSVLFRESGLRDYTLNTTPLPAGIYLLQIYRQNRPIQTQRVLCY